MDLSIIIVNYRNKSKLINCLESLRAAPLNGYNSEIIVVDNNSGDDLSSLARDYKNIKLIVSSRNLGMGGGNNLGINEASGEVILILNPDTIISGAAIKILFDYLQEHPEAGLVGPKLLYPDGSLQLSCANFPDFFMPILRRTFLGDYFASKRDRFMMKDFDHNSLRPVDWLMGSCLMFKKQIKLTSGEVWTPRFDERYFMYFEDIDLARQAWAKEKKVVYNPEAVIIHDHQRQSAKHPWYLAVFLDALARQHISSWFKYFIKWGLKSK
ncbi:MAG: glycosyltransferase [Patescibacteria group bacterium]|jgi:hypothetical protein